PAPSDREPQQGGQQADQEPAEEQGPQDTEATPGPAGAPGQGDGLPQPRTPEPSPPATPAGLPTVSISDDDVVGMVDAREIWRLSFGADSGGTSGLLQLADRVLVGHGNHVLVVDANNGVVARRFRLPARV